MASNYVGRYAPSPTGDLHIGNLRTALVAWLFARSSSGQFLMRIEDLDTPRVRAAGDAEARQLHDLAALGLDWDGPVVRQSERLHLYAAAIKRLGNRTYPCFCSRSDIAAAVSAPHGATRAYPGTCSRLSASDVAARTGPSALRVRAGGVESTAQDDLLGKLTTHVDDFVLVRKDGAYAYNLAAVVDDAEQGVTHVVRGDDLADSAPKHTWLASQLGYRQPRYAHVPLVLNQDGRRLAKRDSDITLAQLAAKGVSATEVLGWLAVSLGLAHDGERVTGARLLNRFDPQKLPQQPWRYVT